MSIKKKSAVIFDVDGVLLDTVPYHFSAWQKMFQDEQIIFTMDDYLKKVNGLPRMTGIKNIVGDLPGKDIDLLAEKKQNYYLDLVHINPPKPLNGVLDFLTQLKNDGFKMAAASSSKNAPLLIEGADLSGFFDVVIGGNDFKNSKPDPEIFLNAAERLVVNPQECIVVEDAVLGILAAKAGGMGTVGLLSSHDLDLENEAEMTIESMKDFRKIYSFFQLTS